MQRKLVGDRAFYKKILAVTIPIMLQNGITNFVNMLDNIMVGQVGTVQMTGVAIANQLLFVFNLCIFGAVSGAGIFTAQFCGMKDDTGVRHTFRFKVLVSVAMAAVAIAVFLFGGETMIRLWLRGEGAAEDAAASLRYGNQYLRIMLVGLIPAALVQAYAGTLRETGETVLPMKAGIVAVCVNLVFNYILIFGHFGAPKLGAAGAAAATVLSRFVELGVVAGWTHTHKKKNPFIVGALRSLRVPVGLAWQIVKKGLPLMINEALWALGMAVLNQCYSVRGLDVVAATNISSTFWNLFSVCFMAVGNAIGIVVGQLLGAGKFDEARDTDRKMVFLCFVTGLLLGAVYFVCAGFIPRAYNTTDSVRTLARQIMQIGACTMPIAAFLHASYFTLRSGGKTFITFLFDSCFVFVVSVPAAFLLSRFTNLPIQPLYLIIQLLDLIKCAIGGVMLVRGTWVNRIVAK